MIVDDIANEICKLQNQAIMIGLKKPQCIVYIDQETWALILQEYSKGNALMIEVFNDPYIYGCDIYRVCGDGHGWKVYRIEE